MATTTPIKRVVLETRGGHVHYAGSTAEAERAGVTPDIVFVRKDGWTLAARREDAEAARLLWEGCWDYMVDLSSGKRVQL